MYMLASASVAVDVTQCPVRNMIVCLLLRTPSKKSLVSSTSCSCCVHFILFPVRIDFMAEIMVSISFLGLGSGFELLMVLELEPLAYF